MYTIIQQIKSILRNRRFIIFTLLFPSLWYLFFIFALKDKVYLSSSMLAIYSAMFGVAGSGLNTFSTKIAKEKEYFNIVKRISPYNYLRYLADSVVTQTILNMLIILVVSIIGFLFGDLVFTKDYVILSGLLLFFGFYYIVIGFFLGMFFNNEVLAAISMPVFMVFMAMNVTPNSVDFGAFSFISAIQKIFPGYYFSEALLSTNIENLVKAIFMISIHIVTSIFILILVENFGVKIRLKKFNHV
ncbi:hypothetical protein MX629_11525 [Carnobacterium divergens]|uniref:ABC-2 type transporter domain-containing protein n=1 Tax=Carnobacterium divergens TaxID=2748 RepID=A0AAW8RBM3_CARDV|nr:hypothetical protein [Carnobacterium divergens]MDT1959060.1 hypothetical protein [Carnobacterium divergens]MDT1975169.1 hypothetical protein [Carnobacterium divergens]